MGPTLGQILAKCLVTYYNDVVLSSTPSPRRTQIERRNESERALLDAAARLFARKGIDETSLADIGAEAGYSRGLANHRFGSRAVLVERLAARTQQAFVAGLSEREADADAMVEIADAYLDQVSSGGEELRAFFVMWGASFAEEAPLRDVFVADDARFRDGIEALVRAGQQRGTIRADADPIGFATVFVALLRGIGAQVLVDPGGVDLDAARATCERLVRTSLTPAAPGQKRRGK
jgi:AcrR family transcriptional regulator